MSSHAWDDDERPTALRPPPMEDAAAAPQTRIPPAVSRRLVIVDGPDKGATFALDLNAPRILVGTSPVCEVRLTDPSVSRRHAALETIEGRLRVSDVNSTNATFIDDVAVVQAYLEDGETLRIGGTTLRLEVDPDAHPKPLADAEGFGRMIGASRTMRRLYPQCERVAKARVPVILEGETGTGKEVLAESIHETSGIEGPFVVFDCTTVSAQLVEAALFGHEKGAFTGATNERPGVFEQAHGGTLLIDEIGDLDLPLQAKLLRVVDRGELRRVGGTKSIKVDVRILAATRRNLDHEISAGRFRDDLFHRLAVARIELPPHRQRHRDITQLARKFAAELGGTLSEETLARFEDYAWPGNVRELRNAVARCVALGEETFTASSPPSSTDLEPKSTASGSEDDWLDSIVRGDLPFVIARRRAIEEFERRYVMHVLDKHGGNVAQAARASGIALRYFHLVKARAKKAL